MGFSDRDTGVKTVYIKLYNTIRRYIFESVGYSAADYLENAKIIVKCLEELDDNESYMGALAKNYAGLCFLNAYRKNINKQSELLQEAIRYFRDVVKHSKEISISILGSLDEKILCAYAKFNLARAMAWSGEEYSEYSTMYEQCIKARMDLSKCSELPEFVRLYWLREAYHAENSRIFESTDYWHANNLVKEKEEALEKLNEMDAHLKTLETTKVAKQPFFEKIKSNAEKNYKKLVEDVVK